MTVLMCRGISVLGNSDPGGFSACFHALLEGLSGPAVLEQSHRVCRGAPEQRVLPRASSAPQHVVASGGHQRGPCTISADQCYGANHPGACAAGPRLIAACGVCVRGHQPRLGNLGQSGDCCFLDHG